MKKLIALLLSSVPALLAQNPVAPPHPLNGFPDRINNRYTTTERIPVSDCIRQTRLPSGLGGAEVIGASGVRVRASMTPIPTTGYHGHDEPGRPIAPIVQYSPPNPLDPQFQNGYTTTDFTGCFTFTFKGPGYAGWYLVKFEFDPQPPCGCAAWFTPTTWTTRGENYYLGEIDPAESTTYRRNFSDLLETAFTAPFSLHASTGHSGKTRAFTVLTRRKIIAALMQWTLNLGEAELDIMRGSLPDGGTLDYVESFPSAGIPASGPWKPPNPEDHKNGQSVDIKLTAARFDRFWPIMRDVGCFTGAFAPDGTPVPNSWWRGQTWVHFVCDTSPLKQ